MRSLLAIFFIALAGCFWTAETAQAQTWVNSTVTYSSPVYPSYYYQTPVYNYAPGYATSYYGGYPTTTYYYSAPGYTYYPATSYYYGYPAYSSYYSYPSYSTYYSSPYVGRRYWYGW